MKKIFLLLLFALIFFTGCKEKYEVFSFEENLDYIKAEIEIPVYENFESVSEKIKEEIEADYSKYKKIAEEDWEFWGDVSSYRTTFQDFSNSRYINTLIKKYIYAGEGLEDEYILTFTYDKKLKEFVNVFEVTGMSLEDISTFVKRAFTDKYRDVTGFAKAVVDQSLEVNAVLDESKYSSFIAEKNRVVLYFYPDQMLPKGYGIQQVEIRY